MEYCEGGSIADIIKLMDSPLKEDQIARICRQTLRVSFFDHL